MTAASAYPPPPEQGVSESRASEPSMEDILASIRRIIADDQLNGAKPGTGRRAQAASAPISEDDVEAGAAADPAQSNRDAVLDLARFVPSSEHSPPPGNESALLDESPDTSHESVEDALDERGEHVSGVSSQRVHLPETATFLTDGEEHVSGELAAVDDDGEGGALLSAPMGDSVMSAFEALAATVILDNKPMLEHVLRDILRPMLKSWLDDNLPGLVERLVRSEIERVARGGRG